MSCVARWRLHWAALHALQFVRVRSKKHEIMIAPEFEAGYEYTLVVVQDPKAE